MISVPVSLFICQFLKGRSYDLSISTFPGSSHQDSNKKIGLERDCFWIQFIVLQVGILGSLLEQQDKTSKGKWGFFSIKEKQFRLWQVYESCVSKNYCLKKVSHSLVNRQKEGRGKFRGGQIGKHEHMFLVLLPLRFQGQGHICPSLEAHICDLVITWAVSHFFCIQQ